jgi:SAM-dependent methyltransferase
MGGLQVVPIAQLQVPWAQVPMYNTIMGLAAGAGLLLIVWLGADLLRRRPVEFDGWAMAFGTVGLIQFVTGLHMTLTWPIAFIAPWDNIYFGETCLAFGTLLLAAALYFWRRGTALAELEPDALVTRIQRVLRPNALFIFALGLALFWIGVFPLAFPVFAAPPEEPISGRFTNYPRLESTAFSLLYFALALGCLLFPWAVRTLNRTLLAIIALAWGIPGAGLILFVAMNFFTHGGLTYNTR